MKMRKKKVVATDCLTLARERISHAFDLFDHISVSFSGGKDSTVCLHLTLEEAIRRKRLPLDVIHLDEEAIPWQTVEYVRRVANWPEIAMRWYCVPVKHRNACSHKDPWWYPWDPRIPQKWCRPLPTDPQVLTELPGFKFGMTWPNAAGLCYQPTPKYGRVGMVMGIRADESITRLRAVSHRSAENYIVRYADTTDAGNVWKVYPIYDWKTEDVWTAPKMFGWDHNHAYDIMDKAGIRPSDQRCAPPYGEEPLENLWMFKECFPELWDKMCYRVPGSATAARYSNTELYAYGKLPEKPAHMTWEQFILKYLDRFGPDERAMVAGRIKQEIERHYRKTSDPLLYSAEHYVSGLSWKFLLMLAVRGDFKQRKQINARLAETEVVNTMRERYTEALERYRAGERDA